MERPLETLSLYEFLELFPDEQAAHDFFVKWRWHNGQPVCPYCNSSSVASCSKPMPYRCRDCRKHFSVRTGTVMAESRLPLHKWLFTIYFVYTSRKGISSLQLSKTINVTQKTAWYLLHRIRACMGHREGKLHGVIEVDETYVGGRRRNMHGPQRRATKRGTAGMQPVFGMRERGGRVHAFPVDRCDRHTLQFAIHDHVKLRSTIYSDGWPAYRGLSSYFTHDVVEHSRGEYVREKAYTNGIESFWALIKRGHKGIYHWMSRKHLHRYVDEFAGRTNTIGMPMLDCLALTVVRMVGVRLQYRVLVT